MLDPYKILGIKEDASIEEIKNAYYRLAKKFHPDHAPEHDRNIFIENFLNITWAYKMLINNEKRKEVNKLLKEGKLEKERDRLKREARDRTLNEGINLLRKNNVRAERYLKMAYLLDKGNPVCKSYYGLVLVFLQKIDEGLELLNKAYSEVPDNLDILLNLSEAYLELNRLRESKNFLKRAMRIEKNNSRIISILERLKGR
uniref:Tetratricopeptide repeat protein n=1 Tax=candidate division WOR-3 bacterium TaxID=2052148 RepID=A0A7C4YRU0_UNCW3